MVPTLQTIMNSSYYYEYRENIHLSVKLTPASVSHVWLVHLTFSPASGGHSPRLLPPYRREMPTGLEVFLTNAERVWAAALRLDPP